MDAPPLPASWVSAARRYTNTFDEHSPASVIDTALEPNLLCALRKVSLRFLWQAGTGAMRCCSWPRMAL